MSRGSGFLLPVLSQEESFYTQLVPGVCPGGMADDEINSRIMESGSDNAIQRPDLLLPYYGANVDGIESLLFSRIKTN